MATNTNSMLLDELSESGNIYKIKNFIISNNILNNRNFFIDHTAIIEWIFLGICIKGSGKLSINGKCYNIERNSFFTILPGSSFELIERSSDLIVEFLCFSIDFIFEMKIPQRTNWTTVIQTSEEQFSVLAEFHSFIVKQSQRMHYPYKELTIKNLLAAYITEVSSLCNSSDKEEVVIFGIKEEKYRQFIKLLLDNVKSERTVGFYADKMCLSAKYLSQLIKKISGKTIMEWINEITILAIKSRLKSTSLSVLQISEEFNFPNPSFFCRYFKKYTGMTDRKSTRLNSSH